MSLCCLSPQEQTYSRASPCHGEKPPVDKRNLLPSRVPGLWPEFTSRRCWDVCGRAGEAPPSPQRAGKERVAGAE